jgi:hypothetical protein
LQPFVLSRWIRSQRAVVLRARQRPRVGSPNHHEVQ